MVWEFLLPDKHQSFRGSKIRGSTEHTTTEDTDGHFNFILPGEEKPSGTFIYETAFIIVSEKPAGLWETKLSHFLTQAWDEWTPEGKIRK